MKWVIVVAMLMAACAGCFWRTSAEECEYDGLPAKYGELLVHLNKNYRTDELHPLTGDLRDLIGKEGGNILMDDADLGVIVAKFDREKEKLARMLDRLRKHSAVRSVAYNWVSVMDDTFSFFGIDWSPDGGKLVFVSNRDGDDDIYEGSL